LLILFWSLSLFIQRKFQTKIFYNLLSKIFIISPTHHIFVLILKNNYEFFKVCKFFQIMHFTFKNVHIFNSFQYMWITLGFGFLDHKLQLCFICHVHYTSFTCGKGLLKFKNECWILKHTLNFLKFQVP